MPDFRERLRAFVSTERQPIRAEAPTPRGDDTTAILRLYDPIDSFGGPWGVSAKEFTGVLDDLPDTVKQITLLINSPGGEVFEGIAILNALRSHDAKVVAVVEGIAASSASFIAVGADELVMARNSELFIHDAWGLCVGNANDMRDLADELDYISDNIASIYAAKAGGTVADWRSVMADETWYSAEQAVEAGLADRVDEKADGTAAKARFDLSIFKNDGRKPARVSVLPPSPSPEPGQEGGPSVDLTDVRTRLGLPDDTTDDAVLDALVGAAEYASAERDAAVAAADPDALALEPSGLPEGVVAIDSAQLDQLRADAAAGREAREQQITARREGLVNGAVADGRIPPARRQAWLDQLAADPGAEDVLAKLAKGTIPVSQIGQGGTADLDSDDALYAQLFGQEVS